MKKIIEKQQKEESTNICQDRLCPIHGTEKVKQRGRLFEGNVVGKFHKRVVIEFERMVYLSKYERYEKRKTRIHSRLPDCMKDEIQIGDFIEIAECRPISKIVKSIVTKKIRSNTK